MDFSVSTGGGGGVYRRVPGGGGPRVGKPAEKLKGKKRPSLTVSIYLYGIELCLMTVLPGVSCPEHF